MKKRLLLFVLMGLPMFVQAQFIATMVHRYADKYYPGEVQLTNGRTTRYALIELPKAEQDAITVASDKKREKTTEIPSEKIKSVTIWSDEFPDVKATLYRVTTDRDFKKKKYVTYWGYPIAHSAWGTLYKCHTTYTMDKATGELWGDYYYSSMQGMSSENPVACVLVKAGESKGAMVGVANSYGPIMYWNIMHKKEVAEVFASNPKIKNWILQKKDELGGCDIQFILDEMVLTQKPHTDALPVIPATPGDDE